MIPSLWGTVHGALGRIGAESQRHRLVSGAAPPATSSPTRPPLDGGAPLAPEQQQQQTSLAAGASASPAQVCVVFGHPRRINHAGMWRRGETTLRGSMPPGLRTHYTTALQQSESCERRGRLGALTETPEEGQQQQRDRLGTSATEDSDVHPPPNQQPPPPPRRQAPPSVTQSWLFPPVVGPYFDQGRSASGDSSGNGLNRATLVHRFALADSPSATLHGIATGRREVAKLRQ